MSGFLDMVGSDQDRWKGEVMVEQVNGLIRQFRLVDWWLKELSQDDRELILETYKPLGADPSQPSSLTHGGESLTTMTTPFFLTVLAGWFSGADPVKRGLGLRITEKAWEVLGEQGQLNTPHEIVSRHLALGGVLPVFYRHRDEGDYFEKAVECARLQIEMQAAAMQGFRDQTEARNSFRRDIELEHSLPESEPAEFIAPAHPGYKQLAIILEKEKRFEEALDLVNEADTAGWNGDWEKRRERLVSKIEKSKK